MIVVDSSALIAIIEEEPESDRFLTAIGNAPRRLVSAVSVYETGVVIGVRRGWESARELPALLEGLGIEIVPFARARPRHARSLAHRLQSPPTTLAARLDEPRHLRRATAVRCAALHRRLRSADRRHYRPTARRMG